jgi:multiple sugar transport system permease protein
MIAPAMVLIFTFGIFPVLFAVYVSIHKWKIKMSDFVGLKNYTWAADNLAYLLFFVVAVGFIFVAYRSLKQVIDLSKEHNEKPWLLTLPAVLHAIAGLLFIRYAVALLPEILVIAEKVLRLERTNELFMQLFGEALRAEAVLQALYQFLGVWAVAWILTGVFWRSMRSPRRDDYLIKFATLWFFSVCSVIVSWFTVNEIQNAIQVAFESGEEVEIWVQITLIATGAILLFLAYRLWSSAVDQDGDRSFIWRGIAAALLIVGGWLLIAEVPAVIQEGNKDMWEGLKVTAFYSAGTIPFQLSISLVLAYTLFQNIRGKEFFRMLFFLPYITPAVASAAVFTLLFSPRPTAIMNTVLSVFGGEPQRWLVEPRGVFTLIADGMGMENFPDWAAGPSLALVVIIIYSIWVYVGYDVVIYLAGLGNISNEINEAAEIDGANRWQILRHITLPLLSPTIYFLSLIAVIGTFKAFNHVFVMRDALALGTVDTFSVVIFDEFFNKSRFGHASAMAFVLFAVILVLTYVNNRIQGSRVFYG